MRPPKVLCFMLALTLSGCTTIDLADTCDISSKMQDGFGPDLGFVIGVPAGVFRDKPYIIYSLESSDNSDVHLKSDLVHSVDEMAPNLVTSMCSNVELRTYSVGPVKLKEFSDKARGKPGQISIVFSNDKKRFKKNSVGLAVFERLSGEVVYTCGCIEP